MLLFYYSYSKIEVKFINLFDTIETSTKSKIKRKKMISAKELRIQASSLNILYAEDEAILRDSMQSSLSKLFKNSFVATNGSEAYEVFKNEDIDIIMTDINMPIMSGVELIQAVQKHTNKEPIIVVLSAHNESKLLTGLINLGINYFLNKPLDKQFMINTLYKACKIINDKKLLLDYEIKLHEELEAMKRKNKILEQKLNQLAVQTNKNIQIDIEEKKEEKTSTDDYFSSITIDDKEELQDLSAELENYITVMFKNEKLNEDYLSKLSNVYKKYASILKAYPEFFELSTYLYELSDIILRLEQKFMKNISQTGIYFESLQLTLENYRQNVWNKKAKDPKFYNASLRNDIQLVIDFLEDKEAQENEIEFF